MHGEGHPHVAARVPLHHLAEFRGHVPRVLEHPLDDLALHRRDEKADGNRYEEADERADNTGQQTHERSVGWGNRRGLPLLERVCRDESSAHHPQAAAQIAGRNEGKRREHAHDEATVESRLRQIGVGAHRANRNIRDRGA